MNYSDLISKRKKFQFLSPERASLVSVENLIQAWSEFKKGKSKRIDVRIFERNLEDNLFNLQSELVRKTYKHSDYFAFYVHDPKRRHIHKASVRDRVLHHLLYKYLYEVFDSSFVSDSYSCRLGKGTHRAVIRLEKFSRIVSRNYTRSCWALKCDVKKFFANIDHQFLLQKLQSKIHDQDILWLLQQVVSSFESGANTTRGIPLGNLTSQVFANIYLNNLDQFIKHQLRIKCYLRYADDFLLLSENKQTLEKYIDPIRQFLETNLKLEFHPDKIVFRKLDWGIDFLGYIVLPHYILPRTKTKQRVFKKLSVKINNPNFNQSLQSYLGYLSHANSFELIEKLKNQLWVLGGRDPETSSGCWCGQFRGRCINLSSRGMGFVPGDVEKKANLI